MNYTIMGGIRPIEVKLHKHKDYEILYFSSGEGYIYIESEKYSVRKNMMVIIPPDVVHCSVSTDNLKFISVIGNINGLIHLEKCAIVTDNEQEEGYHLTQMIITNRYGNIDYVNSLCVAYINFILKGVEFSSPIEKSVSIIKNRITTSFHDSNFNVTQVLNESGYAEDYIRMHFRKITGKTPVELLNEIRVKHAETLMHTYQNALSLSEIATLCGFEDYIYFSRKFRSIKGISPQNYRKLVFTNNKSKI